MWVNPDGSPYSPPDWFPAQLAAEHNHVPLWTMAGLPAPEGPDDPLFVIYTNIALDTQWALNMGQRDKQANS